MLTQKEIFEKLFCDEQIRPMMEWNSHEWDYVDYQDSPYYLLEEDTNDVQ
jgi:hypothetical protein